VTTETDDDGVETTFTVIVPTSRELRESPALSGDFGQRSPVGFSESELDDLVNELQGLMPTYPRFRPRLVWGWEQGQLRFNRVEGLSVGTSTEVPLSPGMRLDLSARIGTGDQIPNVSGGLRLGPETSQWTAQGYYRLASMNDKDDPFDLTSSLMNLAFGTDRGEYYRARGAALEYRRRGSNVTASARAFYERQRSVDRTTEFSLRGFLREDTVFTVVQADDLDVYAGRVALGWFVGTDPSGWVMTGGLTGEAGVGDAEYQRADARLSLAHPLFAGLAGAIEVGAGTSWGAPPVQRSFFIGSSGTLRGFHHNEFRAPTFWRARGEVATAFVAARVSAFTDLAWVGPRSAFRLDDPLASVGIGVSFLDGIARFDVARAVRGSDRWKVHLYLDGLF
jgi:hemolysin activation/secretion protein